MYGCRRNLAVIESIFVFIILK